MSKPISFPVTVYATALLFRHKACDGRVVVLAHTEAVSRRHPLTADEVKARAVNAVLGEWKERVKGPDKADKGPDKADYELHSWDIQAFVIGPKE